MTQKILNHFNNFHNDNPIVYRYMSDLCTRLQEANYERYAIAAIYERMRWHFNVELAQPGEAQFRFENSFRSIYARKLMLERPELRDFFEIKRWRGGDVEDDMYDELLNLSITDPPIRNEVVTQNSI